MSAPTAPALRDESGVGSAGRYVLALLTLVMVFNYIDRIVMAVLAEPIKLHFGISDFQIGLLGGPAFAFVYSTLSIPIATLADRKSRATIIAVTVATWSLFTTLCGFTTQYWQLLVARIGTGVGEAGCTPAAMSLLADVFPPERRATALAVFALGAPIGTFIAAVTGGWIAQTADWHLVFVALGVPGILLAIVIRKTLPERPRPHGAGVARVSFGGALRALMGKPAFVHLIAASMIGGAAMLAFVQFLNAYLSRVRGLPPLQSSLCFGILAGIGIGIGTFLGGFVPDKLGRRYPNALALVGAAGFLFCAPMFWLGLRAGSVPMLMLAMFPASIGLGAFIPVICASAQAMSPPSTRATAVALTLFACQFFGGVLGPPLLGLLSDTLSSSAYAGRAAYHVACSHPSAVVDACTLARRHGLELALEIWSVGFIWSGIHFLFAARTLSRDRVD